jgi:excisionase family DNA binding protein
MIQDSPWLTIDQTSEYAQVSRRTIEVWLKDGLRFSRVGRTVRIRREWIDEYLEAFSIQSNVDQVIEEIRAEMIR